MGAQREGADTSDSYWICASRRAISLAACASSLILLHDDARAGRLQPIRMVAPAMAAACEADDVHAGGARRLNAGYRILDDEALRGRHFHARGSMQEQIRRRLSPRDFAGAEDVLEQVV